MNGKKRGERWIENLIFGEFFWPPSTCLFQANSPTHRLGMDGKKIGCTKVCTVSFMSSGPCPATIAIVPERVFFGFRKTPVGRSVCWTCGNIRTSLTTNPQPRYRKHQPRNRSSKLWAENVSKNQRNHHSLWYQSPPSYYVWRNDTLVQASYPSCFKCGFRNDWFPPARLEPNNQPLETMFSWCVHHAPFRGLNLQEHSYIGIRLDEVI